MNKILLALLMPPSIAGALALLLNIYAKTADAQRATAEVVLSFSTLYSQLPLIMLYGGIMTLILSLAYLIAKFSDAGAHRVKAVTNMQYQRLAGRGSLVSNRLLNSGYEVIEVGDEYTKHASGNLASRGAQVGSSRNTSEDTQDGK